MKRRWKTAPLVIITSFLWLLPASATHKAELLIHRNSTMPVKTHILRRLKIQKIPEPLVGKHDLTSAQIDED